ncbi:MAG: WD40 repeat domain-containing protein [Prevotella sp.]|nr:WD40 repeat domain-containing protein [Prevotella sp.]
MERIFSKFLLAVGLSIAPCQLFAQEGLAGSHREFTQKVTPELFDNESYFVLYISGGKVYNIRSFEVDPELNYARNITIQPGSQDCAVITKKKAGAELKSDKVPSAVYVKKSGAKVFNRFIKDKVEMLSIAYAPNGKRLAVGYANNSVNFYDTKKYELLTSFTPGIKPALLALSVNEYFAAVTDGKSIEVWNIMDMNLRKKLQPSAVVNSISFSNDNSMMAVLTADGTATIYDTKTFNEVNTIKGLGEGIFCKFHPENKYLGVTTNRNTIVMLNLKDSDDKVEIKGEDGLNHFNYCSDYNDPNVLFLLYASGNDLVWEPLSSLKDNLGQMLLEKVNTKMNEWMKKRDDESMDEYRIRVNDETRAKQMLDFEHELATDMAGDIINRQNVKFGNYNTNSGLLAVDFDGLPSIMLDVPRDEIATIGAPSDLTFTNTVYAINDKDEFEVIYTEALNKQTGKKYVYDNLDRKSVTAMTLDEDFVPLELIQQSNMEEMILKDIKEKVMEKAKLENKITDHTHINVNTEVINDVDANGKKILNYKVGYNYEVEQDFVAKDDFASGRYKTSESNAAMSMLKIVEEAFSNDFAQYIKPGKRIKIKVSGSADAAPIHGTIPYDGCYGEYDNELCYKNGVLSKISVNKASGVTENEQLAFLRASGVKDYIANNITSLKDMVSDYEYNIELSDKKGGEYRRISVEFLFFDAFEK